MKTTRDGFVKQFISFLSKDDIIIFAGKSLCKEAHKYKDLTILCIDDDFGYGMSILLGMVMGTKKRIYMFCEDYYLLKDVSSIVHLGISKLVNLFLVVVVTGHYPNLDNMPTIVDSIPNIKSLLFGTGFVVHDYTKHFKTQMSAKQTKGLIASSRGPLAIFFWPENTKSSEFDSEKSNFSLDEQLLVLRKALKEEKTSLFVPPLVVIDKVEEK